MNSKNAASCHDAIIIMLGFFFVLFKLALLYYFAFTQSNSCHRRD